MDQKWWSSIEYVTALIGTAAISIWASTPHTVQILIMLMVIDIAVGFLQAYVNKKLDSDISTRGLAKKAIILFIIGASALIETALLDAGYTVPLTAIVAAFYIVNEVLSIIENASLAGLPVPEELKDALTKFGKFKVKKAELKAREQELRSDGDELV